MVVALNASWKILIAYFLIKSLTEAKKANIIKKAIITLENNTSDERNFKNAENLITSFPHPITPTQRIYAIFDACHMLKLMRTYLGN